MNGTMKQNQKNCLLRIVTLVLLCCSVGFASVARAQNVQLHERVTSDSSSTNHSCVRPASYTYQDTFGEVDCIPVERGNCDFVTICRYHRTSGCFPPEAKILMADRSTVKKVGNTNSHKPHKLAMSHARAFCSAKAKR